MVSSGSLKTPLGMYVSWLWEASKSVRLCVCKREGEKKKEVSKPPKQNGEKTTGKLTLTHDTAPFKVESFQKFALPN